MSDSARYLTPQRCADALEMSDEFIRGEIKGGRLPAIVLKRSSGRSVYRIDPDDFTAYVARHWQRVLRVEP